MKNRLQHLLIAFTALAFFSGCVGKDQLKKTLEENPDIVIGVIKKHPKKFLDALNEAVEEARKMGREDQVKKEEEALEAEFSNPKKPKIDEDRVFFGPKDAPITIVEYSDFECPFCSRGYSVMNQVKEKYGDKVRVLYKHLPLSFHPMAKPAAQYFEAVAIQSKSKAEKFHDMVFENQDELKTGKEKFLNSIVKKVGADVSKVLKDIKSSKVADVIKADEAEAKEFGFSGTPGFLVNGVSVKGAYPIEHFEKLIDRHLGKAPKADDEGQEQEEEQTQE